MKRFYVVSKYYPSYMSLSDRFEYMGENIGYCDLGRAKRFNNHDEIAQFLIEKGWAEPSDIFKIEEYYTL